MRLRGHDRFISLWRSKRFTVTTGFRLLNHEVHVHVKSREKTQDQSPKQKQTELNSRLDTAVALNPSMCVRFSNWTILEHNMMRPESLYHGLHLHDARLLVGHQRQGSKTQRRTPHVEQHLCGQRGKAPVLQLLRSPMTKTVSCCGIQDDNQRNGSRSPKAVVLQLCEKDGMARSCGPPTRLHHCQW